MKTITYFRLNPLRLILVIDLLMGFYSGFAQPCGTYQGDHST